MMEEPNKEKFNQSELLDVHIGQMTLAQKQRKYY